MKSYKLNVNGSAFEVVIKEANASHVMALVNGVEQKILIEEIKNLSAPKSAMPASTSRPSPVAVAATTPAAAPAAAPRPAAAVASGDAGVIAPIPGQIKQILVKVGDQIKIGQKVLIIEAMKLENEINSSKAGTVKSILVNIGDSVGQDQLMIEIA